jgi:uncharacterized lipoprotein YajG
MIRILWVAALAFLAGGCAITSMEAKIAPDTQVTESNIGDGAVVGVVVLDERPTQDVGKRAVAGASIEMNDDLAAIYQAALIDGLTRKGFAPVPGYSDGADLKVEIRALSYDVSTGWWTAGIATDSAIKGFVLDGAEPYERLYRANDEDRAAVVPGAKGSNKKLNAVVNSSLRQLLEDQKLLEVLASGE